MKTSKIFIAGIIGAAISAAPAVAGENCDKSIINFSPPAGSYKQISPNEAQKMKNRSSDDQKEISITLERMGDTKKDEETK